MMETINIGLPSYPKVYAVGHAAIPSLFDGEVTIEEKVDGSQFSFGIVADQLFARSKGAEVHLDAPDGMFSLAVRTVKELAPLLHPGWVYRGEYLQKPKHNVLNYERVPLKHIILFDINPEPGEHYLSRIDKEREAKRLGLEIVPVLHIGPVYRPEELLRLLDNESILGSQKVEGIVVKNYSQFCRDGKAMFGKYVREDFKEAHSKEWKASNPTLSDVVDRIIASLKNEKRWEKSVFHLRDRGELSNSPKDIGALIKEVQRDVAAEEGEYISAKLAEWATPRILRAVTGGLPEWYKKRLLESTFEPTEFEHPNISI